MIRMRPSKNQIRFLIALAAGYAISTGNVFAQYYNQPTPRIALQQSIGSSETIDLTGDAPEEKSASDRVSSEATLPAKSKKEFLADKIDSDSKGSIQPLGRTIPSWQLPTGSNNCNYSACNLPPQPQVPAGRCAPCLTAIDCANSRAPQQWCDALPYDFQPLRHGEHIGPVRIPLQLTIDCESEIN